MDAARSSTSTSFFSDPTSRLAQRRHLRVAASPQFLDTLQRELCGFDHGPAGRFDASHATGISLSQPTTYNAVNGGSPTTAGPTGDDLTLTYALSALPCDRRASRTSAWRSRRSRSAANGRVFLGSTTNASFLAGVATSLTDAPFLGSTPT